MGCKFELAVIADNSAKAERLLKRGIAEIKRIENLLSEFLPDSETSRINKLAAINILPIRPECFNLIKRALDISKLTAGDFDITTAPLKKLYNFKNEYFKPPTSQTLRRYLKQVGYQKIKLFDQQQAIHFKNSHMKLSFAAIGKGYASDKVKKLWQAGGLKSGYINASGDISAFGERTDGTAWKIGIANPDNPKKILLYVPLRNACVATSGDYEQYFNYRGKRYSHNLNPHTGKPLTGLKSVTVFSPSAELSDALATAVYVKGVQKGLNFVNQLPQTHAIIIDENNRLTFSKKIQYEKVKT